MMSELTEAVSRLRVLHGRLADDEVVDAASGVTGRDLGVIIAAVGELSDEVVADDPEQG